MGASLDGEGHPALSLSLEEVIAGERASRKFAAFRDGVSGSRGNRRPAGVSRGVQRRVFLEEAQVVESLAPDRPCSRLGQTSLFEEPRARDLFRALCVEALAIADANWDELPLADTSHRVRPLSSLSSSVKTLSGPRKETQRSVAYCVFDGLRAARSAVLARLHGRPRFASRFVNFLPALSADASRVSRPLR